MAENCIFCGKTLSFWTSSPLACGGADQPACGDCTEKYGKESILERARLALDTVGQALAGAAWDGSLSAAPCDAMSRTYCLERTPCCE